MRITVFGILMFAISCFSQDYSYKPDPYKGHEFINSYNGARPIQTYIDSIVTAMSNRDNKSFGEVKVIFKFDSLFLAQEIEVINFVDPYFDSLVSVSFLKMGKDQFQHLKAYKLYGLNIKIGPKKYLDQFQVGFIMFADGKTKKSEKIYKKLLSLSPRNTQVMYYLGRSMIENGNAEGKSMLQRAANDGDVDAIKYLKEN